MRPALLSFTLIGIAILLGVAPGCGGTGDGPDLAARTVDVLSRNQAQQCGCAVAGGEYADQAECLDIGWIAEPVPDEACLRQAYAQFSAELAGVECAIGGLEQIVTCSEAAACNDAAFVPCFPLIEQFDSCGEPSQAFQDAVDACGAVPAELARRVVLSRDRGNAEICECAGDLMPPLAPAECEDELHTYEPDCLASLAATSPDARRAVACELAGYAEQYDCLFGFDPDVCDGGSDGCFFQLSIERAGGFFCGPLSNAALDELEKCDTSYVPPPVIDGCLQDDLLAGTAGDPVTVQRIPGNAVDAWLQIDFDQLDEILAFIGDSENPVIGLSAGVLPALFLTDQSYKDECDVPGKLAMRVPNGVANINPGAWNAKINELATALIDFKNTADAAIKQAKADAIAAVKCFFLEEALGQIGALLFGCDVFG